MPELQPRVIIVVHGVGVKTPGWSLRLGLLAKWGPATDLVEANFNEDASSLASYTNFVTCTPKWIAVVCDHIERTAASRAASRIDIVAHSWGSVIAAAVLGGGSLFGASYEPLHQDTLGSSTCRHLVTMGNPLCHRLLSRIAGIHLSRGRPPMLTGRWLNMYNRGDRLPYIPVHVGNRPLEVDGCENVELDRLTGHTGYWKSKKVAAHIRDLA